MSPWIVETVTVTFSIGRLSGPVIRPRTISGSCAAAEAANALGLREGPIHGEFRVNDRGVWVIEIAARSIGGRCSGTLRFAAEISLEELILRHALGMHIPACEREQPAAGVMMAPHNTI